jgi:thiamine-monophosphate kinase
VTTVAELGEVALVAALKKIFGPSTHPAVELGIGDDAALLRSRHPLAWTIDSVVEGVDWLPASTPSKAIGHRAAAVNLSDLAAMGARPVALLLALELPPHTPVRSVLAAAKGLAELARAHKADVIGGDVGFSPGPQRWTVTALGEIDAQPLLRTAARPGDDVWLVGDVGLAALGLHALKLGNTADFTNLAVQAHLWPQPQIELGKFMARSMGRVACIDISDGLGLDARRLALASGVALALDLPRPDWLTPAAEAQWLSLGADWRQACASGGDDYALLVATAPGSGFDSFAKKIGHVCAGPAGDVELAVGGVTMDPGGWLHGR